MDAFVLLTRPMADAMGVCDKPCLVIEGLIKSLGFEDAVVTNTTENINVIVKSAELTSEEAAQILDIVTTETDKTALDVRIIPVE